MNWVLGKIKPFSPLNNEFFGEILQRFEAKLDNQNVKFRQTNCSFRRKKKAI